MKKIILFYSIIAFGFCLPNEPKNLNAFSYNQNKPKILLQINYLNKQKKIKSIDTAIVNYFKRNKFTIIDEGEYQYLYNNEFKKIMDNHMNKYGQIKNEALAISSTMNMPPFCRNLKFNVFVTNIQIDSINLHFEDLPEQKKKLVTSKTFINNALLDNQQFIMQVLDSCSNSKDYYMLKK